ncbi:helix-turn-helix domain-containing protein [Streptomyces sp. DSM 44915]|uniref:Helix-turn-helix domain-containing protein n=1 Tax=Streptomyces chisholmiae TaxID=3075540 RepID=A0ABU2JL36_9ACTN|nr:helix-turn-helix domain-containing protein [Streptomyces sp. DSM 44915]MDT0265694.1 helix-turn-helix domain-containing protein [Streptomyces sp. DSM 44915]
MSETARDHAPRRRRADAQRNRERLLAEADAAFREQGTEASLERIARRAGVAVGTLYGHFPSRAALLDALLRDRHEALFTLGDALLATTTAPPPFEALTRWMRAVAAHGAGYTGLAEQLWGGLDDPDSELHAACARLSAAGRALTERARAAGAIRAELTPDDIFALVSAAAWLLGRHRDTAQADRLLTVLLDGLRP